MLNISNEIHNERKNRNQDVEWASTYRSSAISREGPDTAYI